MAIDKTFLDKVAGYAEVIERTGIQLTANGQAISAYEMLSDEFYLPSILGVVHSELAALLGAHAADSTFEISEAPATEARVSQVSVNVALDAPVSTSLVLDLVFGHVVKRILGIDENVDLLVPSGCSAMVVELSDVDWSATPSFVSSALHRRARGQ